MKSDLSVSETPNSKTSLDGESSQGILTDQQAQIFDVVNFVVLSSIIGWFGLVSNIINMVVFYKQGFENSVNISLFGLAIADLCSLLTLQWICVCRNPLVVNAGVPWVLSDFMNLTGAWPHVVCGRVSCFITVYVTAERCLCIIAPLKVKQMVSPAKASLVISLIYLLNILTLVPEYASSYLEWKAFPEINRTLLVMSYIKGRESVAGLVFILSSFTGMISFVAVVVLTTILVVKLKQTSKWRETARTVGSVRPEMANRDKKTIKMIAFIAGVLIVCYLPGTCLTLATFIQPEFNLRRRYINLAIALWSIAFVFQTVNSSVNIVVYYTMSSNYRHAFYLIFERCAARKLDA